MVLRACSYPYRNTTIRNKYFEPERHFKNVNHYVECICLPTMNTRVMPGEIKRAYYDFDQLSPPRAAHIMAVSGKIVDV